MLFRAVWVKRKGRIGRGRKEERKEGEKTKNKKTRIAHVEILLLANRGSSSCPLRKKGGGKAERLVMRLM